MPGAAVNAGDKLVPLDPRRQPVRYSHLKHMEASPAHYLAALASGVTETRAMRVGYLVHALVLGGNSFAVYDGQRRGKDWEVFATVNDDKRIVTVSELEDAKRIATQVLASGPAMDVLAGYHEREVEWKWPTGRACLSHVDAYNVRARRISELKVTSCAAPGRFGFHSERMLYHAQLAFYRRALRSAAGGIDVKDCYIVAVEDSGDIPPVVYRLEDHALDRGDRLNTLWMERLAVCEAANIWPGYSEAIVPLDVRDGAGELVLEGEDAA
jgi:hypothetical protein